MTRVAPAGSSLGVVLASLFGVGAEGAKSSVRGSPNAAPSCTITPYSVGVRVVVYSRMIDYPLELNSISSFISY
jgi:hypothetical protein